MVLSRLLGGATDRARGQGPQRRGDGEDGFALYPPRSASGLDPEHRADFARRLEAFRAKHALLDDHARRGCLQIFDLDDVRQRFAARWPGVREKAYQIVEGTLNKRLGAGDLYVAVAPHLVYVLTSGPLRNEAETRGRLIAADVTARLCGTVPGGVAIRVKTLLFDFTAGLQGIASLPQLVERVEAFNRRIDEAERALFDAHADRLRLRYRPMVARARRTIVAYRGEAFVEGEVAEHAVMDFLDPGREPDERQAATGDDPPPGEATPAAKTPLRPAGLLCPHSVNGVFDARLDTWSLAAAADHLMQQGAVDRRALVSVPLHGETLATTALRERFLEVCRRLPESVRESLCLEVVGLSPALAPARSEELLAHLRPWCARIVVHLVPAAPHAEHLRSAGAHALALTLPERAGEDEATAAIDAFVREARDVRLPTVLTNARSKHLLHHAWKAGVDLLGGDALTPTLARPGARMTLDAPQD
ncbi:MAG: hypothetical protein KDE35_01065 [Geminicoccaceae bacterium]|nr:hypothetical protein [Geminicoccaceae bacterium]